jgi:formylglycine-generating enzyme required for sulfatase activity
VFLDAYWLDRDYVARWAYARFAEASGRPLPWPPTEPDWPATLVTWPDADAFCRWVGKRLPTEAEWEKAARGTDGRLFPWGNEAEPPGTGPRPDWPPRIGTTPWPPTPYGVHMLPGAIAEWVADWWAAPAGPAVPRAFRNPLGPTEGTSRVVRGQSARVTDRQGREPSKADVNIGFRCARSGP